MNNRRSSLLGQASDVLAAWGKARRRPSVRQPPPPPVLAVEHVIDITAPPPDEELEERQRLRDAAAQSIGLGPLLEPTEEAEEEQEPQEVVILPPFPASSAALAPFAALAASLPKYYPPGSLRIFALAKQWKARHLLLSVPAGSVSHLHLFKGPGPDDRELERLEINADSVVFVAESPPDPDAPAHIVKVAGADVGAHRRDWNPTDDAGRTVWLLQLTTPADAQRWISAIKSAIFDQRTQRAGLAPSTVAPSPSEPRGDMDVMLEMRIHAANTPTSPNPALTPTTARPLVLPPTPTSPTGTYAASLAPSASSRSVRSVATAPAPGSPSSNPFSSPFFSSNSTKSASHKSGSTPAGGTARSQPGTVRPDSAGSKGGRGTAVAALKGLFDRGRPRSSSASSFASVASTSYAHSPVSVHSHAPSHASSYGSAEEMGLGDSFGRMGSLLANGHHPKGANGHARGMLPVGVSSASNNTNTSVNGVGAEGGLERRIVGQRDDVLPTLALSDGNGSFIPELTESPVTNGHAEGQEVHAPKRRTLNFFGGNQEVTPLQPPPRRRRWTGASVGHGADASTSSIFAEEEEVDARKSMSGHPYANGYANGTVRGDGTASPSTPAPGIYAHPHANGSSGTAGSFGVRSVQTMGEDGREGSVRTRPESVRTGTYEGREGSVRTYESGGGHNNNRLSVNGAAGADHISERSVSTGTGRSRASSMNNNANAGPNGSGVSGSGSGGGNATNGANGKSRRWSNLPKRLTPPASPPPAAPQSGSIPHPYAAAASERERERDRPPSRSSFGSAGKSGWARGKRASGVSVGSVGGVSGMSAGSVGSVSAGSNGNSGSPARAGTRTSVPPPPRPAPTGALPPAPGESPNGRTSFRESRASSLSVSFRDAPPPGPVANSKSLPMSNKAPPASQSQPTHTKGASSSSSTSTFRESMSMSMTPRALRLSLMAPKPPPAGVLPPRPDEVVVAPPPPAHEHRRASTGARPVRNSTSSVSNASGLHAIPASPAFPPPRGPLPPTPAPVSAPAPAPTRHTSLKLKRLRILSAPPAPHPAAQQEPASRPTSADASSPTTRIARARPGTMTLASFLSASTPSTPTGAGPVPLHPAAFAAAIASAAQDGTPPPPATPIGEKIIQWHTQNDPSFLEMSAASTPVLRALPALPADPPAPESEYAEIVSLPPPRRGSRQISIKDIERVPTPPLEPEAVPLPRDEEAEGAGPGPGKLFSLSRHGSAISLSIVTTVDV